MWGSLLLQRPRVQKRVHWYHFLLVYFKVAAIPSKEVQHSLSGPSLVSGLIILFGRSDQLNPEPAAPNELAD